MIFVHLGAGAADLDSGANFRCGFTEFIKKKSEPKDEIFLVEANPKNISNLEASYKNFSNVKIFNIGISVKNEEKLEFFYTEDDAPHYQVCTTKIDHLKKHYPNSIISKFHISAFSINDFFKKKIKKNEIDFLSIDLEGIDYDVLMSIDLNQFNIKNISIEYIHLTSDEKNQLINHLNNYGYSYCGNGYDHNNFDFLFCKKHIYKNRLLSKIICLISNKHVKYLNYFITN